MCYIHWRPDVFDDLTDEALRPRPQLKWVIPVDVAQLGASLEGYQDELPAITTLRLCHRFGESALSKLPQEILDHIVSDIHRTATAAVQLKWKQTFACFQGRCSRAYHATKSHVDDDELWFALFGGDDSDGDAQLNPDDYTSEDKANMIDEYEQDNGYDSWPEWQVRNTLRAGLNFLTLNHLSDRIWEAHFEGQSDWLNMICLCKNRTPPQPQFAKLNHLLRDQFGMAVILLHEVLSDKMTSFLPDIFTHSECSYYTSAFITLHSSEQDSAHSDGTFFEDGNHHAFCQAIDPKQLNLDEEQRLRFAKTMRLLDLNPHYRLSELESLLNSRTQDASLWEISYSRLSGCPPLREGTRKEKQEKLEQFLFLKSKELAKRPWPQLMNLSASDAVSPF